MLTPEAFDAAARLTGLESFIVGFTFKGSRVIFSYRRELGWLLTSNFKGHRTGGLASNGPWLFLTFQLAQAVGIHTEALRTGPITLETVTLFNEWATKQPDADHVVGAGPAPTTTIEGR